MDLDRLLRHLQEHVASHMPDAEAHPQRWLQWLAGTYNLLGILSGMVGVNPTFEMGIARLFNKWRQHPFDHTPPPAGRLDEFKLLAEVGKKHY